MRPHRQVAVPPRRHLDDVRGVAVRALQDPGRLAVDERRRQRRVGDRVAGQRLVARYAAGLRGRGGGADENHGDGDGQGAEQEVSAHRRAPAGKGDGRPTVGPPDDGCQYCTFGADTYPVRSSTYDVADPRHAPARPLRPRRTHRFGRDGAGLAGRRPDPGSAGGGQGARRGRRRRRDPAAGHPQRGAGRGPADPSAHHPGVRLRRGGPARRPDRALPGDGAARAAAAWTSASARARCPCATRPRSPPRWPQALAAAHEIGVVHCDVKPGNVMLTPGGAKVLDFGIAAITGETAGGRPLYGTPGYLAPERLAGAEADAGGGRLRAGRAARRGADRQASRPAGHVPHGHRAARGGRPARRRQPGRPTRPPGRRRRSSRAP